MLACNTNWYKILLPTLLLVASSQTLAQTSFEITPFAGYRMSEDFEQTEPYASTGIDLDNSASYGVVFAWPFDNTRQGELLISHSGASLQQNAS